MLHDGQCLGLGVLLRLHTSLKASVAAAMNRESQQADMMLAASTDNYSLPLHADPSTHRYILQLCFVWIRSMLVDQPVLAMRIFHYLVDSCHASVAFSVQLLAVIRILLRTTRADVLHEVDEQSSAKNTRVILANMENLSLSIHLSAGPQFQAAQELFHSHLHSIASYLSGAVAAEYCESSLRAELCRVMRGYSVLLEVANTRDSLPIAPLYSNRRIVRIHGERSVLFPTKNSCPFTLVIESVLADENESATEPPASHITAPLSAPLDAIFGDPWSITHDAIQKSSTHAASPGWACHTVLIKGADGILQEAFACQLIRTISEIWREARLPIQALAYQIEPIDDCVAAVEFIHDARTVDYLKRRLRKTSGRTVTLADIFSPASFAECPPGIFESFQSNFIASCAGFSIITYILRLGDRHNKNVLIHRSGALVHIDFGFVLESTPGDCAVESLVPFKLPAEYAEFMGQQGFDRFRELILLGMTVLRQNIERVAALIEMGNARYLPCLGESAMDAAQGVRERALYNTPEPLFSQSVSAMIDASVGHWITRGYDLYQKLHNGIEH